MMGKEWWIVWSLLITQIILKIKNMSSGLDLWALRIELLNIKVNLPALSKDSIIMPRLEKIPNQIEINKWSNNKNQLNLKMDQQRNLFNLNNNNLNNQISILLSVIWITDWHKNGIKLTRNKILPKDKQITWVIQWEDLGVHLV